MMTELEAMKMQQEKLVLLSALTSRLNTVSDRSALLGLILDTVIQLARGERGFLVLSSREGSGLQTAVARGLDAESARAPDMEEGWLLLRRTLTNGEPVLVDGLQEDSPFAAQQGPGTAPGRGILCVPLSLQGEVVGAAYVDRLGAAGLISQEELPLVMAFANAAALAIENARLQHEVQRANEARSEFVSLVTHELRAPMTSIKGYADLLSRQLAGPLNETQSEFLEIIQRNLLRMSVLVDDLSDINRLESGHMRFDISRFDLREVVQDVTGDLQDAVEARQQILHVQLTEDLPDVAADRTRIGQVLSNLMNNANKYTPAGGKITVRVQPDGDFARIDVADTGIGISEENQDRLFSQFFRAEDEEVREQAGWGLGLSVVKKLVEAQGGQVAFESEVGRGSTFTFTVPLAGGD